MGIAINNSKTQDKESLIYSDVKGQGPIGSLVRELALRFPDEVRLDVPLSGYTTYRVGGPAAALCEPSDLNRLQEVVRWCQHHQLPFRILGEGANVLVHDRGVDALVIRLNRCAGEIRREGTQVVAGAGARLMDVVLFSETHSLSGLEQLAGIPGTVGGALHMNAGAFGREIGDVVESIILLNQEGKIVEIPGKDARFGYRQAPGLENQIVLACRLQLRQGDRKALAEIRQQILQRRSQRQPLEFPSCGSVFKRPEGHYAGALIEQAGLKGLRRGDAMVSTKHANFIVNVGHASAADIFELILTVQETVYRNSGIWLEPEVQFWGFTREELKRLRRAG